MLPVMEANMSLEPTWIVVADGGAVRFFHRPKAGAPLAEMEALGDLAKPAVDKHQGSHRHRGTAGGRRAPAHEIEEADFLKQVAAQIDKAVVDHSVGQLALCASPRALGVLRNAMSTQARRKLVCEIAKDLVREPVASIDERMIEHRV
jgi:protein required for attachment to host cells